MANPKQVYDYCTAVKKLFPDMTWVLHFHNTRGMGLANIMAGMLAGIKLFDTCFAGLGGCPFAPGASGNIATEDLIHMCHEMGVATGCDLDKVIETGRLVQQLVGHDTDSSILRAGKCSDIVSPSKE
jgi:hydroxymethylglutaryl-CoA lyase